VEFSVCCALAKKIMIYTLDLRLAGFLVGGALVIAHLIGILHGPDVRAWLKAFPRSKTAGIVLLAIAGVWSFWLVSTMDLGEFTSYRTLLMILVPVSCALCVKYVDEFLPVRALGMVLLLLAEPVLEAAFLRPETSRLLLVALAYVWIVLGMCWVGMPYLLRDQIGWVLKSNGRWLATCVAGLVYGVAVIICALFFYHRV
jgi:hypothetical protein